MFNEERIYVATQAALKLTSLISVLVLSYLVLPAEFVTFGKMVAGAAFLAPIISLGLPSAIGRLAYFDQGDRTNVFGCWFLFYRALVATLVVGIIVFAYISGSGGTFIETWLVVLIIALGSLGAFQLITESYLIHTGNRSVVSKACFVQSFLNVMAVMAMGIYQDIAFEIKVAQIYLNGFVFIICSVRKVSFPSVFSKQLVPQDVVGIIRFSWPHAVFAGIFNGGDKLIASNFLSEGDFVLYFLVAQSMLVLPFFNKVANSFWQRAIFVDSRTHGHFEIYVFEKVVKRLSFFYVFLFLVAQGLLTQYGSYLPEKYIGAELLLAGFFLFHFFQLNYHFANAFTNKRLNFGVGFLANVIGALTYLSCLVLTDAVSDSLTLGGFQAALLTGALVQAGLVLKKLYVDCKVFVKRIGIFSFILICWGWVFYV